MVNQIQHGDVLIKEVGELPRGAKKLPRKNGVLLIAEGEATGHNHVITAEPATLYELNGGLYMEVTAPVTITHEEHLPLEIPEGVYEIGRVKEYDYFQEMERRVID